MCRIVIVDNNPFSFLLQPLNGIPCIPFSAGQTHDTQVARKIQPPKLQYLFTGYHLKCHCVPSFSLFHFLTNLFFSFWMFFFHSSSSCRCRKTWDLCFMKGFTCPNGFKSRESLQLVGNSRIGRSKSDSLFVQSSTVSLFKAVSHHQTPTILLYSINCVHCKCWYKRVLSLDLQVLHLTVVYGSHYLCM